MNKLLTLALPLAAAIALVGCGGSSGSSDKANDTKKEDNKTEVPQTFSSTAQWIVSPTPGSSTCFDFDTNKDVNCDGIEWDIKLVMGAGSRATPQFYTNSGPIASGKGGTLGSPFNYSWAELQSMQDTSTTPDGDPMLGPMFLTDSMNNGFSDEGPYGAFEYAHQKILSEHAVYLITLNNASDYDASSNDIYAVQLVDYYGGATGSTSGYPKVRYAKLSDLTNVKEVSVNASTDWAYFDLTTGQTVSKDGNWQLGFNRYNIITNSGDSGTGSVGSFLAQKAAGFYDADGKVDTDKLTNTALIASAKALLTNRSGWDTPAAAKDWKKDALKSALNPAYQGDVRTGLDYGFYFYTGLNADHPAGTHAFIANPENGVLLRSGEGNSYARVHLTNIAEGQYTFDFDVAPAVE